MRKHGVEVGGWVGGGGISGFKRSPPTRLKPRRLTALTAARMSARCRNSVVSLNRLNNQTSLVQYVMQNVGPIITINNTTLHVLAQ